MQKLSSCKTCHWRPNLACKFPGEIDIVDGNCSGWKLKAEARKSFYDCYQDQMHDLNCGTDLDVFICGLAQKLWEKGKDRTQITYILAMLFFGGDVMEAREFTVYLPRDGR